MRRRERVALRVILAGLAAGGTPRSLIHLERWNIDRHSTVRCGWAACGASEMGGKIVPSRDAKPDGLRAARPAIRFRDHV